MCVWCVCVCGISHGLKPNVPFFLIARSATVEQGQNPNGLFLKGGSERDQYNPREFLGKIHRTVHTSMIEVGLPEHTAVGHSSINLYMALYTLNSWLNTIY